MEDWKKIIVYGHYKLLDVMKLIDETGLQFSVVIDKDNHLIGTVTDGDIRRALLSGKSLQVEIYEVMNKNPIFGYYDQTRQQHLRILRTNKLKQLPIVKEDHTLANLVMLDDRERKWKDNIVLLMVGGLGTRLRPLTNDIPKPMLHVGGKPLLETIIDGFKQYGYTNFILSVNYKKEVIQDYFQNGEAFGVSITYVEESMRMGTAGALSLLPEIPTKPLIVMNGDLLTQINFDQLMNFHLEQQSLATMCVREYEYQIPYGVIETNGPQLVAITEKPIQKKFVNAGVYVLSPEVFRYIPSDKFFDMPELFESIMKENKLASIFPIHEYWLDIGRVEDFEKANDEYRERYQ